MDSEPIKGHELNLSFSRGSTPLVMGAHEQIEACGKARLCKQVGQERCSVVGWDHPFEIGSIPGRPETAQLCVTHPSAQRENQAALFC